MLTDNELIARARNGDVSAEELLAKRYRTLVRIMARQFFLVGGDGEDLIQEGMMGLLRAIRNYDPQKGASFKTYAEHCIRNSLINVIESASSMKHSPLNSGVSIDAVVSALPDSIHQSGDEQFLRSTEVQVIRKENRDELYSEQIKQLSKFEQSILEMYLSGMSYKEMAAAINKSEKSVDNAVQRIRKKLAKHN